MVAGTQGYASVYERGLDGDLEAAAAWNERSISTDNWIDGARRSTLLVEEPHIHANTESLIRFRDGELAEGERKPLEAHLSQCARCRAEYQRLSVVPDGPEPDGAMFSGLLANIERWEAAEWQPERNGSAVKQRVTSDIEPYLGSVATGQVLAPVSGENLLTPVESVLTVFLGKRAAALLVNDVVDHAIFLKGSFRKAAGLWNEPSPRDLTRQLPRVWAWLILLAGGCAAGLGLAAFAAWGRTGDPSWVGTFFRLPGTLATVGLALLEVWFCLHVVREFGRGDALRPAWMLIVGSAVCNLASALFPEVLRAHPPLTFAAELHPDLARAVSDWQQLGLTLGGTCRFALLAAGLVAVLRVYGRLGFLKRLRAFDWVLLAIPAAYVLYDAGDLITAGRPGARMDFWLAARWLVDPLLWLLLGLALLLFRSVRGMGRGWVSRCWAWYSAGIFLTSLGDIGLWAANHGWLPRHLLALTWYAWLPAATAFALAPAFQLEAVRHATTARKKTD